MGSCLTERCSTRGAVGKIDRKPYSHYRLSRHEHLVAAHLSRVGEKEKRPRHQCHIKYIISCAAEDLFGKYHCESCSHGYHPARRIDRANERNQDACDEETFLYLLVLYLFGYELYAEPYYLGCQQFREYGEETV